MLFNSFGATCGVFSLCVLLLAVDTEAREGKCECREGFVSSTAKPVIQALVQDWEDNAVAVCRSPLMDTCADNCNCFCPVAGIDTNDVNDDGAPIVTCTDGTRGEPRCEGENDRGGFVFSSISQSYGLPSSGHSTYLGGS